MANLNALVRELLSEPRETLDVEHKEWLDLADNDHRATVAKEIIALANHGGGYTRAASRSNFVHGCWPHWSKSIRAIEPKFPTGTPTWSVNDLTIASASRSPWVKHGLCPLRMANGRRTVFQ
jgi:hypothetical protein